MPNTPDDVATNTDQTISRWTQGAPMFKKVRPRRGFEYISEQIRDAVSAGELTPGAKLPAERQMAEIFGVSRQGVREAIRGLEISGLVETRPGASGGVFIKEGDPAVVTRAFNDLASLGALSSESLLEARIKLTTSIIELAAERITEQELDAMEKDVEALDQQSSPKPGMQRTAHVTRFYSLLAAATHNEVLVVLMNALTDIVQQRLNALGPDPLMDVTKTRRKIIDFLRAGDAENASEVLTKHLQRVEELLSEKERAILG